MTNKGITPLAIRECECGTIFRDPDLEHDKCAVCRRREELQRMADEARRNGSELPRRFGRMKQRAN